MRVDAIVSAPVRYHRATTPRSTQMSAGQGSTGNVIAAVCSFFIPGLGQLVQGRLLKAIIMFVLAAALWLVWLGWIIHLWSILDAALYKPGN
jgi:TM2 domain-containing membrane protein YozV